MPTIRLIYASAATAGMTYGEIMDIMNTAVTHNGERGITGMLCYGSGQFLQALEGDRAVVNGLYHRIATDSRHSHCQLLSVAEIQAREFAEWSMKVVNWDDGERTRRHALLEADTGSAVFNPSALTSTQAAAFMRHLAELERELAGD